MNKKNTSFSKKFPSFGGVRGSLLGVCFLAFGFGAVANDTIRFTWQAGTSEKDFDIIATSGEQFVVSWGNGMDNVYTGIGGFIYPSHTYSAAGSYTVTVVATTANGRFTHLDCSDNRLSSLDVSKSTALAFLYCYNNSLSSLDVSKNTALISSHCYNNQLSILDVSNCTALGSLDCSDNQLSSLDVSKNTVLTMLLCYNNRLPLSDLYVASQKVSNINMKRLGTQTLLPQTVPIGQVLFSEQSTFNGIYTDYVVTKNGNPAPTSDYTINNGTITFHNLGNYTITMTNSAITSHTYYPAKVIAEINVSDVGIVVANDYSPLPRVFPNPTTNQLQFTNYELRENTVIEIYDIVGCNRVRARWTI